MKRLILATLPFLFAACATVTPKLPADNQIAPNFRRPGAGALIVMLPPEVETIDMEAGTGGLKEALHQQLEAAGYKVAQLEQDNYTAIWAEEVAEAGGIYDQKTGEFRRNAYLQAVGHLVQRVTDATQATMVVQPRLELRMAELSGVSAVWDGQQRRSEVKGSGGDAIRHDGTTLGLSVGLNMFAASGEMVLSTHGGASLPYKLNLHTNKNEVRSDLFDNQQDMADGVALALTPFLKTAQ